MRKRGNLHSWTDHQLVGVDGSPLQVHGYTVASIHLGDIELTAKVVVVSPLATEAILDLDFLSKHGALIDLQQRKLHLDGFLLPLEINNQTTAHIGDHTSQQPDGSNCARVRASE